jgi:hypothetical protein
MSLDRLIDDPVQPAARRLGLARSLLLWWLRVRRDFLLDQMRIACDRRDVAAMRGDGMAFVFLTEILDQQCARCDRLEARIASLSSTTERQFS